MSVFDPDSFEARVTGSLARIEQKIDCIPDHSERIQALEGWVKYAKGAWAVLVLIITLVAGALGIHLKNGR